MGIPFVKLSPATGLDDHCVHEVMYIAKYRQRLIGLLPSLTTAFPSLPFEVLCEKLRLVRNTARVACTYDVTECTAEGVSVLKSRTAEEVIKSMCPRTGGIYKQGSASVEPPKDLSTWSSSDKQLKLRMEPCFVLQLEYDSYQLAANTQARVDGSTLEFEGKTYAKSKSNFEMQVDDSFRIPIADAKYIIPDSETSVVHLTNAIVVGRYYAFPTKDTDGEGANGLNISTFISPFAAGDQTLPVIMTLISHVYHSLFEKHGVDMWEELPRMLVGTTYKSNFRVLRLLEHLLSVERQRNFFPKDIQDAFDTDVRKAKREVSSVDEHGCVQVYGVLKRATVPKFQFAVLRSLAKALGRYAIQYNRKPQADPKECACAPRKAIARPPIYFVELTALKPFLGLRENLVKQSVTDLYRRLTTIPTNYVAMYTRSEQGWRFEYEAEFTNISDATAAQDAYRDMEASLEDVDDGRTPLSWNSLSDYIDFAHLVIAKAVVDEGSVTLRKLNRHTDRTWFTVPLPAIMHARDDRPEYDAMIRGCHIVAMKLIINQLQDNTQVEVKLRNQSDSVKGFVKVLESDCQITVSAGNSDEKLRTLDISDVDRMILPKSAFVRELFNSGVVYFRNNPYSAAAPLSVATKPIPTNHGT